MTAAMVLRAWTVWAAVCIYAVWCALLIAQGAGLQYDEALLVLGAVHMRKSAAELALAHDPNTWITVLGRSISLMTVRYVGAVKEYLFLPIFAVFGPEPYVLRLGNAVLGALGIWGLGRLLARQAGPGVAAGAALILALNPAYAAMTVFDNGTVAVWMGSLGLVAACLSRYLDRRTGWSAFWLGLSVGLGIWARANFVWMLAAMLAAAALVWRRALVKNAAHWAAAAAGALAGGFPFLLYQVISKGGTWEARDMFRVSTPLPRLVTERLVLFADTLLSDGEHRAMWSGPALPGWQRWLFPAIVAAGCAACLLLRGKEHQRRWGRACTIALLGLAVLLFSSRLPVAEHHLIVLVPLGAAVVAIACWLLLARYRALWPAVAALGALYAISAVYWQVAAVRGLYATGGVGPWSDAVNLLSDHLARSYPYREVKVLDWGLLNNLYVLSDGELQGREIYDQATSEVAAGGRPWTAEVAQGGVFLTNGPENRQFPAATDGFLRALNKMKPSFRHAAIVQRNGAVYAEVYDVDPKPR